MAAYSDEIIPRPNPGEVEIGTIGWDTTTEHFVAGEPGTDEEGYTLIRVQLYRGKDPTKKIVPGIGQGHQVLCHMSSAIGRIPPRGTRVYVAFPHAYTNSPLAGVIMASVEKNKVEQLEKDRAVIDYGDQALIIKAKDIVLQSTTGNVTMMTTTDGTKAGKVIGLKIGHTEMNFHSPWINQVMDYSGFHVKCAGAFGPRMDMGTMSVPGLSAVPGIGSLLDIFTGYIKFSAPAIKCTGMVYLGPGPDFNTAVHAPASGMAMPPMPIPITTGIANQTSAVWISK